MTVDESRYNEVIDRFTNQTSVVVMVSLPATLQIAKAAYLVTQLDAHPDVAERAYRLQKVGDETGESYDVRQTKRGWCECECKGFLRWSKPCKHIRALKAAGLLKTP
jgi:hypothetical protein